MSESLWFNDGRKWKVKKIGKIGNIHMGWNIRVLFSTEEIAFPWLTITAWILNNTAACTWKQWLQLVSTNVKTTLQSWKSDAVRERDDESILTIIWFPITILYTRARIASIPRKLYSSQNVENAWVRKLIGITKRYEGGRSGCIFLSLIWCGGRPNELMYYYMVLYERTSMKLTRGFSMDTICMDCSTQQNWEWRDVKKFCMLFHRTVCTMSPKSSGRERRELAPASLLNMPYVRTGPLTEVVSWGSISCSYTALALVCMSRTILSKSLDVNYGERLHVYILGHEIHWINQEGTIWHHQHEAVPSIESPCLTVLQAKQVC